MKWEYEATAMCGEPYEDTERFSALGQHRWELVWIQCTGCYPDGVAYFKRPVQDDASLSLPDSQPRQYIEDKVVCHCPRAKADAS